MLHQDLHRLADTSSTFISDTYFSHSASCIDGRCVMVEMTIEIALAFLREYG